MREEQYCGSGSTGIRTFWSDPDPDPTIFSHKTYKKYKMLNRYCCNDVMHIIKKKYYLCLQF